MENRYGRIYEIYRKIIDRLPSTYPKAVLTIYNSVEELRYYFFKYYRDSEPLQAKGNPPNAFCDETGVIHIPLILDKEWSTWNLTSHYLHELGHLYALKRYGIKDPRWRHPKISEHYADKFASRWINKLEEEDFFVEKN